MRGGANKSHGKYSKNCVRVKISTMRSIEGLRCGSVERCDAIRKFTPEKADGSAKEQ